jgi:hypothetical protein
MITSIERKIIDRILDLVYKGLAYRANFKVSDALIISGDPRGGTTWLAEIVKGLPNTAMIWEPLAISEVAAFKRLGFQWRQYIEELDSWPEAREVFMKLFSGKLLSSYLCQQTSPQKLVNAKYLLIKFCRANQLLPWLTKEFQFNYAPIYLIRHPCAVVASQLKKGGWSHVSPTFEIPKGRYQSFYSDHIEFLKTIDSVEKRLAATWCLCNRVPLNHPENNKRWITITYESMLLNGYEQLRRIEKRWNLNFPSQILETVYKASYTTLTGSPIARGKVLDQLTYWESQLSDKQVEDIISVLDYFQIKVYSREVKPFLTFND